MLELHIFLLNTQLYLLFYLFKSIFPSFKCPLILALWDLVNNSSNSASSPTFSKVRFPSLSSLGSCSTSLMVPVVFFQLVFSPYSTSVMVFMPFLMMSNILSTILVAAANHCIKAMISDDYQKLL